ncbi:uncharacterized protein [Apostichopus japonicus]|uniref:uncharacterized protein n=1 Tax=Stichopus japonicus TaxID=307972 RepID=UPI003AB76153
MWEWYKLYKLTIRKDPQAGSAHERQLSQEAYTSLGQWLGMSENQITSRSMKRLRQYILDKEKLISAKTEQTKVLPESPTAGCSTSAGCSPSAECSTSAHADMWFNDEFDSLLMQIPEESFLPKDGSSQQSKKARHPTIRQTTPEHSSKIKDSNRPEPLPSAPEPLSSTPNQPSSAPELQSSAPELISSAPELQS